MKEDQEQQKEGSSSQEKDREKKRHLQDCKKMILFLL